MLELPTDRPRPREQAYRGDVAWRTLDERITRRLEDFSRRAGVSQFMTLLAAFKVLLYRYSGQEDVLVGSPFASRPHAALEELIGYFANILVLRTDLSGSPSFAELLRRVRETTVGALEHQDMPFSRLVGLVQPARNPAHHPLFQVQFILQHEALFDHLALPGVQVEPIDVDTGSAKFDLTLQVFERRKGLRLALEFNTDLWDRATAERMLGHYEQVLANALEDQERTIDRLTVLTPREWRMLNEEWNVTQLAFPEEALIHELFEAQAGATPGRIAVEFDGHRLTYAELNEAADRLAARLRALGVGPDVLVGLCVGRSLEMIVGVLGILKAGGAYLPLDPTHPRERLDLIVEDARASIIVTQRALLASLPDAAVMHVFLDEEEQSPTPLPFQPRQRRNDHAARTTPSHLAYVLYTSGSTGKPKGVQIEHRAVVNFLTSMRQTPGLCADDVVLAVTTVSFDIAGLEMHLPLTTGARVVIVSGETAADGALLARQIELHSATLLQATPATWRFLLEAGWPGSPRLKALCGGEALPPELARQLLPRCAQLW
ncbi:MAG: non-ribosomal peptide synthetase, partial [Geminicoccales bacterium]